jgi:EpsI family protein
MQLRLLTLTVMFLASWGALLPATRTVEPPPREPLLALPFELGEWTGESTPFDVRLLGVLGVDDYIHRTYTNAAGQNAGLYIGYYAAQRHGDSIHSPMNCLPGSGWQPLRTEPLRVTSPGTPELARQAIDLKSVVVQKDGDRQLVVYWYQSQGRTISNEYAAKAMLLFDAIRTGRTDAAIVRIAIPIKDGAADGEKKARDATLNLIRVLMPQLGRHLPV